MALVGACYPGHTQISVDLLRLNKFYSERKKYIRTVAMDR